MPQANIFGGENPDLIYWPITRDTISFGLSKKDSVVVATFFGWLYQLRICILVAMYFMILNVSYLLLWRNVRPTQNFYWFCQL